MDIYSNYLTQKPLPPNSKKKSKHKNTSTSSAVRHSLYKHTLTLFNTYTKPDFRRKKSFVERQ